MKAITIGDKLREKRRARSLLNEQVAAYNGFWNGEPAVVRKCRIKIKDESERFPLFWAKTEGLIGKFVQAVEVRYPKPDSIPFYIYDEDGSGWFKVTEGYGSPRWGHSSITPDDEVEYLK